MAKKKRGREGQTQESKVSFAPAYVERKSLSFVRSKTCRAMLKKRLKSKTYHPSGKQMKGEDVVEARPSESVRFSEFFGARETIRGPLQDMMTRLSNSAAQFKAHAKEPRRNTLQEVSSKDSPQARTCQQR